jgi:hypothetical protein
MNERVRASAVWREALAIVLRHPLAAIAPALLLGTLTETPYLLDDPNPLEALLAFVTESLSFYLYVAYAELMVSEVGSGAGFIPLPRVLRDLLLAAPVVPVVAVASLAAIALPTAAASVLVIPGLWLMTRWSLFAPVIVRELLGPLAALRRSNELVRGHFEVAFLTAALAVVLEQAVADAGASGGLALTGSEVWGEWVGGSVATVAILPVTSFATALAYGRLRRS